MGRSRFMGTIVHLALDGGRPEPLQRQLYEQLRAAIVGGRVFSMPHASKAGVVGVVLVFVAIIAYLVLPGIVRAMTGSGCV